MSIGIGKYTNMKRYPVPKDVLSLVKEPTVAYRSGIIRASRRGVARTDFVDFVRSIKQSVASMARIIPASYSTLTKKNTFDQATSERIFELAELYARGKDVFGDIDKFNAWLQRISKPLGNVTPYSLLDTSHGIDLVGEELGRIDHGVFA